MAIITEFIRNPDIINNVIVNPPRRYKDLDTDIRLIEYSDTVQLSLSTQLDLVFWVPNQISICKSNRDVMSFNFSGCLMAKYKADNISNVAHIHCDSDFKDDCRGNFARFLINNKVNSNDLLLFRPLCDSYLYIPPEDSFNRRSVAGIITQENRCYSMVLEYDAMNRRCNLVSVYEHITHQSTRDNIYEALMNFNINISRANHNTQYIFEIESRILIDIIEKNTLIYRWF